MHSGLGAPRQTSLSLRADSLRFSLQGIDMKDAFTPPAQLTPEQILRALRPMTRGITNPEPFIDKPWSWIFHEDWNMAAAWLRDAGQIPPTFITQNHAFRRLCTAYSSNTDAQWEVFAFLRLMCAADQPIACTLYSQGWALMSRPGESREAYRQRIADMRTNDDPDAIDSLQSTMLYPDGKGGFKHLCRLAHVVRNKMGRMKEILPLEIEAPIDRVLINVREQIEMALGTGNEFAQQSARDWIKLSLLETLHDDGFLSGGFDFLGCTYDQDGVPQLPDELKPFMRVFKDGSREAEEAFTAFKERTIH
jgi:hypothetical protein